MSYMFYNCLSLKSVDISNLDLSEVIDMNNMFDGCKSIKFINFSSINSQKLSNLDSIFYNCNSLQSIDLTNLITSSMSCLDSMFNECNSLSSINLSSFDTSTVSSMAKMFYGCESLISINLSNFNTRNVYNMSQMFYGCDNLNFLDISNFDLSYSLSYDNIFSNINNIKFINIYNVTNDKFISYIFDDLENDIFVCEKNDFIQNTKAYNCCDYNFTDDYCPEFDIPIEIDMTYITYETYKPYTTNLPNETISPEDSNGGSNSGIYTKNNSSSSIPIGVIIGVILGAIAIIGIIIVIIYCYRKKCRKPSEATNYTVSNTEIELDKYIKSQNIIQDNQEIYKFEPDSNNSNPKKLIIFETTSQMKVIIKIDPEKRMTDLIKFYFKIINKPELFNDNTILFLMNSNLIQHKDERLIKSIIPMQYDDCKIIVVDNEDKIH